jgi:MoxR-like ATPase
MEFYINETKEIVRTNERPIVIITSNAEKELPDAFLRRCLFCYIAFPEARRMEEIVRVHYPDIDSKLLAQAMESFYKLRGMKEIQKKPGTSELLDWLQALSVAGVPLGMIADELPFIGVLLKKNQDIDAVAEVREKGYSLRHWV